MTCPGLCQAASLLACQVASTESVCTYGSFRPDSQELYGYVNMATREWKDGLLSFNMRELANIPTEDPKWIMLDGDLDANWIESMNSVMDDNRLLTLPSNERCVRAGAAARGCGCVWLCAHAANNWAQQVRKRGVLVLGVGCRAVHVHVRLLACDRPCLCVHMPWHNLLCLAPALHSAKGVWYLLPLPSLLAHGTPCRLCPHYHIGSCLSCCCCLQHPPAASHEAHL